MRTQLIKSLLVTLLLGAPITAGAADPVIEPLQDYTAVYALRRGSLKAGEATYTFRRNEDGSYSYESVTHATGLVALFRKDIIKENVQLELHDDQLRPIQYEYLHENTEKNRNQKIIFDWQNMIADSNNRGNESKHDLNANTVDRASMPLVIGYALVNDALPRRYSLLDHGKERNYRMVAEAGGEIKTKAGKFETVLVKRHISSNDQKLRIWLSLDHNYLPVRIENEEPGGETTSLQLLEFEYTQPE